MSIKPNIPYTDKNTEQSVSRLKVETKNKSIIRKNLALPTVISLGTYIKKTGNANFFLPFMKNDTDSDNKNLYLDHAKACLSLINFNISFLEEADIISNQENYYNKAIRKQIKTYIYGLDNQVGKFSNNYEDFKKQILNLIKDNIAFVVPSENTVAYKVFLKSCKEIELLDNKKSIYSKLDNENQIKGEKLFIKLTNLYIKLLNNKKNLEPLFIDIQKITKQSSINI